jgi:hypothetical protein
MNHPYVRNRVSNKSCVSPKSITAYFIWGTNWINQTFLVRASCPQNVYLIPSETAIKI